ncbi:MAG: (2Fe-2S)-binding protein [Candidatus Wallbacteria bacterium]|nr:(2Fe-2S)-binding protein [Candidatus Wallbacteria bacterium]
MKKNLKLQINGTWKEFSIEPGTLLLDLLRTAGYQGVKDGCREGECGACTVHIDGRPINSCTLFALQADGRSITTIEGLGNPDHPHPIQEAFVETGAVQCGFCIPGKIMSVKALLDRNPDPDEHQIREALSGNLCRCTGYVKQIEAVKLAARRIREKKGDHHE